MPTIQTGNPGWDQNLSTLGNALFPDPSKIGQGYYYGSEARKAQAETNRITNQQNYGFRFMQMQPDSPQQLAPPTYSPAELSGLAPIINAPSNLPMASGPGRPPLSSVMTGPAGGQMVPQTMTPQQAAAATPDQFNNHPGNRGTPPPVSPPAPGASPAPNTTGSDGSVPGNDPTARGFHPASVTPAGGGTKWAPPADSNGSPARTPVSLATYVATAVQSGMDATQASLQGQAYLAEMFKQGSIDAHTYHELLAGTGQAQPIVADITGAANIKGHQITAGATIESANIRERGETQRTGMATKFIVTDPGTGAGKEVPLSQLQGLGGTPTFAPAAVTEGVKPIEVQPGGPGTPPISMPTGQAQREKAPIYQSTDPANAYGNFIDPNHPLKPQPMTKAQAAAKGWMPEPTDPNQVAAVLDQAILNAKGDELTALRERRTQIGPPPKQADAEETSRLQFLTDQQLEKLFPVPPSGATGMQPLTNTHPAGASPDLGPVLSDLADQYYRLSPDPAVRGDRIAATNKALQQLLAEKRINSQQDRSLGITGTTSVTKPAYDKAGNAIEPQQRFRVDLLDPKTGQPYPPGTAPVQIPMTRPLSSTPGMTLPAPGGAAPIGTAPAGTPDGPRTMGGKPVVVRGGLIYPQ